MGSATRRNNQRGRRDCDRRNSAGPARPTCADHLPRRAPSRWRRCPQVRMRVHRYAQRVARELFKWGVPVFIAQTETRSFARNEGDRRRGRRCNHAPAAPFGENLDTDLGPARHRTTRVAPRKNAGIMRCTPISQYGGQSATRNGGAYLRPLVSLSHICMTLMNRAEHAWSSVGRVRS